MKAIAKISVFIVLILSLSSCAYDSFMETLTQDILKPMNLWKPKPLGLGKLPEGGSVEFNQGWEDGCETGLAAYGGGHYRNLGHKFKQDYKMIHNPDYYRAWQDAYSYCRWYIWNYNRAGSFGELL